MFQVLLSASIPSSSPPTIPSPGRATSLVWIVYVVATSSLALFLFSVLDVVKKDVTVIMVL